MFKQLFGSNRPSTLIQAAFRDFNTMLVHSEKMLDLALEALLDNRQLEVDLRDMDDVVDDSERMVRRTILEHLSVNPSQDLVASLILVSMVQDAERIGDFARGLAEVAAIAGGPREAPWVDDIREIASELIPLFSVCRKAFDEGDEAGAIQVIQAHVEIKPNCQALTRKIMASDLNADMAITYATSVRILRRISSHLANIASSVVQPYDRIRHGDEDV